MDSGTRPDGVNQSPCNGMLIYLARAQYSGKSRCPPEQQWEGGVPNSSEKNRERRQQRIWVKSKFPHPEGGWWEAPLPPEDHGKFSTYSNWHCRCPPCQESNTEKQKEFRQNQEIPEQRSTKTE